MKMDSLVRRTELENGIRIVTERMPFVRSVSIGVWVKAGTIDETTSNNGISHFLEHLLFKGTTSKSAMEIASSLESLGGSLNGSTGKEFSVYSAQVLDENTDVAIDVLSDLIQNPRFDEKDIELEKNVVIAEINHAQEDPEELLMDLFYQKMFPDHPLGYFIYGSKENVQSFSRDDLALYRESLYTSNHLIFAAAGNIDHETFVDLVSGNISTVSSHPSKNHRIHDLPKQERGLCDVQVNGFQQAHICLGVRTFGFNDERKYPMALMDVLLGGGMSSRLFQNIREKYGFAYSVYSFTDLLKYAGVWGTYMACAEDKAEEAIELLRSELLSLAKHGVAKDELDRVKSQVKGNILLGLESSARRMRKIGDNEYYSSPHLTLNEVLTKIMNVKSDEITDLAQQYFDDSQFCTIVLKPNQPKQSQY